MLGGEVKYYRERKRNHGAASCECWGDSMATLNGMVSGSLSEKLTPEQTLHRGEGVASTDVGVKSVLGSGTARQRS